MSRKMRQRLACRMGMGKSAGSKIEAAPPWPCCPKSLCNHRVGGRMVPHIKSKLANRPGAGESSRFNVAHHPCDVGMVNDKPGMFRSWADALYWLGIFVGFDVLLYYIGALAVKVLLH